MYAAHSERATEGLHLTGGIEPMAAEAKIVTPKRYTKPTLLKAGVLSAVTATNTRVSGTVPSDCWVARAAFGETDIRWMIFRAWLFDDAPAWFRSLYIRHGESVGAWLSRRERARRVVRGVMMLAINRKVRRAHR
jgi:hypothetical protein